MARFLMGRGRRAWALLGAEAVPRENHAMRGPSARFRRRPEAHGRVDQVTSPPRRYVQGGPFGLGQAGSQLLHMAIRTADAQANRHLVPLVNEPALVMARMPVGAQAVDAQLGVHDEDLRATLPAAADAVPTAV